MQCHQRLDHSLTHRCMAATRCRVLENGVFRKQLAQQSLFFAEGPYLLRLLHGDLRQSLMSQYSPSAAHSLPWLICRRWVQKEARPISLRQLTFFGRTLTENRLLSSANYVRIELPTRFWPWTFPHWSLLNLSTGLLIAYAICRRCLSSLSPILI